MKIMILVSGFNGFSQKVFTELIENYEVQVEFALTENYCRKKVLQFNPDLIICPFLKDRIPTDIWEKYLCIIIHPGIPGDRGPSSLDWAIIQEQENWGITALAASEEMDAGAIWGSYRFPMPKMRKSYIYNTLVSHLGVKLIVEVIEKYKSKIFQPIELKNYSDLPMGQLRPLMKQSDRKIDWESDKTLEIVKKINASDGFPGVLSQIYNMEVFLFNAWPEWNLCKEGHKSQIIAKCNEGICISTVDGAVWITHLKKKRNKDGPHCKIPATKLLSPFLVDIPEIKNNPYQQNSINISWNDIHYEQQNDIGYLSFDFYNGAMSTEQCKRLEQAIKWALHAKTKALVLMGGDIYWSNGINLNTIELAESSELEAWDNINAMNDIIKNILKANKPVLAALEGNAGAGGVFLALACDHVIIKDSVILNPHYKTLGLFGSEYWTLTLPARVGESMAEELTTKCSPLNSYQALNLGLVDNVFESNEIIFKDKVIKYCENKLTCHFINKLTYKKETLIGVGIEQFRRNELAQIELNIFTNNLYFREKRKKFVYKVRPDKFCKPKSVVSTALREENFAVL